MGQAAKGTRRVEVFREPRPAGALKREAAEARAEARQCQEDKARLLAERKEPGGLMGAAWLERGGEPRRCQRIRSSHSQQAQAPCSPE
ncbi:DUF2381 family protein [Archangium violaceum]|nr:DUF2381 family protein [Archangium violaceum]